jgi:two-component system chemotaxis response regulator CheB
LIELAGREIPDEGDAVRPATIKTEVGYVKMERDIDDMNTLGELSPFTCPSCQGSLWELRNGDLLRYRCHTGHAYSRETLLAEQANVTEDALYAALRAVEEKAAALRRLGARTARSQYLKESFEGRAEELERNAEVLRALIEQNAK